MIDVLVIGIVVATIGAMIATGAHYLFAKAFARRYASAFNVEQTIKKVLTNDMPHMAMEYIPKYGPMMKAFVSEAVYDGVMRAQDQYRKDAVSAEMSARGQKGAEVRAEKKQQKEAQRAAIIAMIEQKFPGASAFIPQIEKQLGMDLIGMAAANPQAAMALLSKFMGKGGGLGGGTTAGGGQDWITP